MTIRSLSSAIFNPRAGAFIGAGRSVEVAPRNAIEELRLRVREALKRHCAATGRRARKSQTPIDPPRREPSTPQQIKRRPEYAEAYDKAIAMRARSQGWDDGLSAAGEGSN